MLVADLEELPGSTIATRRSIHDRNVTFGLRAWMLPSKSDDRDQSAAGESSLHRGATAENSISIAAALFDFD